MKLDRLTKFAWFVLVFNLAVIQWGALVRASGSGAGCGDHWPLCNGQVVPAIQVPTLIEFAHRISSGAALLLVVGMAVWARRTLPRGHWARWGAGVALVLMVAETLAGASLVLFKWVAFNLSVGRMVIMPVHLGITFSLLAALTLTAVWVSGGAAPRAQWRDAHFWSIALGWLGVVVVGMAGTLTALGEMTLPLAEGGAAKDLLARLYGWHPLIAVSVALYLIALVHSRSVSRPRRLLARLLTVLLLLQLAVGLVNALADAPLQVQLLHQLLANLVWITLVGWSAAALAHEPLPEERKGALLNGRPA